jgi:putative PIN family toxin of toxin-antitoxin system
MTHVVLDTNVLLVCVSDRSPYHLIFKAFLENKYTLCVTTDILDEYAEILTRFSGLALSNLVLETIENAPNTRLITRYFAFDFIKIDPDDNKFVDCAIASNADFIVTHDNHFNVLKTTLFPKVTICNANQFLEILRV